MKCLVSGATGFIGRQLCQQLAARGDTVIALSRSGETLPGGMPTLALDLTRREPEDATLGGTDVVFHLAGIAHRHAAADDYDSLNVDATLRLARQAARCGVRCFIFLSSVKAMGTSFQPEPRSEQDCQPPDDPYGLSKWRAECALREEFAAGDMAVVILRPTLVFGAQPRGNLRLLADGVRWGLPRPPAGGARSMVALADLVDLLCRLSTRHPPGVSTWIATGAVDYSTREIYDLLRQAAGKGRGRAWAPRWAWRLGAWLFDRVRGDSGNATWDKLFGTERYSNGAVLAATDWRPRQSLQDLAAYMVPGLGSST